MSKDQKNKAIKQASDSMLRNEDLSAGKLLKLSRLDYILAPVIAALSSIWFFMHIWTARNWDDLYYMNMAQYPHKDMLYFNRYGHVYLMKLVIWLTGDVITGARIFTCFIFFGTCILVYWCARMLGGKKSLTIALIAVLLLCMQPIFSHEAGSPLSDFTVMFLVVLMTFLYLHLIGREGKTARYLMIALGALLWWSFKSKETSIGIAVLFLGLGFDADGKWTVAQFLKNIRWAALGFLIGIVIFAIFDGILLKDPFFAIRPSNYFRTVQRHSHIPAKPSLRIVQSWYTYMTTTPLLIPFLLYVFVGIKSFGRQYTSREKIAWLFPLSLFVLLPFVRSSFYIIPRYLCPAMPIICIWGAQFFRFDIGSAPLRLKSGAFISRRLVAVGLIVVSAILVMILMTKIPALLDFYKIDPNNPSPGPHNLKYQRPTAEMVLYMLTILPVTVTLLLVTTAMSKKRGLPTLLFTSLCLFLAAGPPFSQNITSLKNKEAAQYTKIRFLPYILSEDQIHLRNDLKILVSQDIRARSPMLGRQQYNAQWHMFNIYFNAKLPRENVVDGDLAAVAAGGYDYGFVTGRDLARLKEQGSLEKLLQNYDATNYRDFPGLKMRLYLLKKRSNG